MFFKYYILKNKQNMKSK